MARMKNSELSSPGPTSTLIPPRELAAPEQDLSSGIVPQVPAWTAEEALESTLAAGGTAAAPDVETLRPGLRDHPRYRVIQCIGRGGMGEVYIAEHRLMGRIVVLKTVRLDLAHNDDLLERFHREARASAKLNHPNIVTVFDAEESADCMFLAMEYLQGEDLWEAVGRRGPFDVKSACTLLRQATEGVRHAHERGVIHRDIKPNNLFLVEGDESRGPGTIKVLDFGLAKVMNDGHVYQYGTPVGFAMGTIGYMSPEQKVDARSVGIQADIFSLGRTLYYALSGRVPYPNGMESWKAEMSGRNPVIPLGQFCPSIPSEVGDLIERMTVARSDLRLQSCAEVLSLLDPLCRS